MNHKNQGQQATYRAAVEALVGVLRLQAEPTAPALYRRASVLSTVFAFAVAASL